MTPTYDLIAVKPDNDEGEIKIIRAPGDLEPTATGVVVAVGAGGVTPMGVVFPLPFTVGQRVLYSTKNSVMVKVPGESEKLAFVRGPNVFAVLS